MIQVDYNVNLSHFRDQPKKGSDHANVPPSTQCKTAKHKRIFKDMNDKVSVECRKMKKEFRLAFLVACVGD